MFKTKNVSDPTAKKGMGNTLENGVREVHAGHIYEFEFYCKYRNPLKRFKQGNVFIGLIVLKLFK